MQYINLETWPRKQQYEFFNSLEVPHFSICADIAVTKLYHACKARKESIFLATLYCHARMANQISEFRTRIHADGVVMHDTVGVSYTTPLENDLFGICVNEYNESWKSFHNACSEEIRRVQSGGGMKPQGPERTDLIYLSCVPWISFTSVTHPHRGKDDTIPRFAWGKFYERDGERMLPCNLQCHHALLDGIHMAKFLQGLEEMFKEPESFLDS